MKENYMFMEDKLKGEYYDVFKNVELYAVAEDFDFACVEEVMMDLLDTLLEAQNEQRQIEKIVGTELEEFCESLFEEYKKRKRLKSFVNTLYRLSVWVLIIEFIFFLMGDHSLQDKTTDIMGYFIGFFSCSLFSAFLYLVVKPNIFRWKKLRQGLYIIISLVGSGLVMMVLLKLMEGYELCIPFWAVFLVPTIYIVCFKIIECINRYKKEGSIRKKKDLEDRPYGEIFKSQMSEQFPEELYKRFQKINKKREKKGKKLMTPEEFTEKIRKEVKDGKVASVISIGILSLFLLALIIHSFIKDGLVDTLIFALVLTVAEVPVFLIFRASGWGEKEKIRFLEECDRACMTLPAYLEYLEAQKNAEIKKTMVETKIEE